MTYSSTLTKPVAEASTSLEPLLLEFMATADQDLAHRAASLMSRRTDERLKIAVVGEFSRGKSTLINALVGEPMLPAKVNPTTAAVTVVTPGGPNSASVSYNDGSSEYLELPFDKASRVLQSIVTGANHNVHQIRQVKIQVPGRLELLNADLIDTPGLNDFDDGAEDLTFRVLREADIAIMLLDAQQPLTSTESSFIREKVLPNVRHVIFVVNRIDEILNGGNPKDLSRVLGYVRQKLRLELSIGEPIVHAVSAKDALRSRSRDEPELGFAPFAVFESDLVQLIAQIRCYGGTQLLVHRLERLIHDQRSEINRHIDKSRSEVHQIDRQLIALENEEDSLLTTYARIRRILDTERASLARAIETKCRQEAAAVESPFCLVHRIEGFAREQLARIITGLEAELRLANVSNTLSARSPTKLNTTLPELRFRVGRVLDPPTTLSSLIDRARNIIDSLFPRDPRRKLERLLDIQRSCLRVTDGAHQIGSEFAETRIEGLSTEIRSLLESKLERVRSRLDELRDTRVEAVHRQEASQRQFEARLRQLRILEERCKQLTAALYSIR